MIDAINDQKIMRIVAELDKRVAAQIERIAKRTV